MIERRDLGVLLATSPHPAEMPDTEVDVLWLRYYAEPRRTLRAAAVDLGKTLPEVRSIEEKAKRRLRRHGPTAIAATIGLHSHLGHALYGHCLLDSPECSS